MVAIADAGPCGRGALLGRKADVVDVVAVALEGAVGGRGASRGCLPDARQRCGRGVAVADVALGASERGVAAVVGRGPRGVAGIADVVPRERLEG